MIVKFWGLVNSVNNKILVEVNHDQKIIAKIGNTEFTTAKQYDTNHRNRNSVLAKVVNGMGLIDNDTLILCHHNLFTGELLPYSVTETIFSIPFKENTVFFKVKSDGAVLPLFGNITCNFAYPKYGFELPVDMQKPYIDRVYVDDKLVFIKPYNLYEICYNFNNEEKSVLKINKSSIVGFQK
jgi:hypothetical protein